MILQSLISYKDTALLTGVSNEIRADLDSGNFVDATNKWAVMEDLVESVSQFSFFLFVATNKLTITFSS